MIAQARAIGLRFQPLARKSSRYLYAVLDQGIQSVANFVVTLWMLKVLEPHAFGLLALTVALANFALVIQESLAATPLSVRYPALSTRTGQGLLVQTVFNTIYALVATLLLAGAIGAGAAAFGLIALDPSFIIAAAIFIGAFGLRAFLRSAAYSRGHGDSALLVSVFLLVGLVAAISLMLWTETLTLPRLLLAMAAMHALPAVLVMSYRLGRWPRLGWRSLRRFRWIWQDSSWSLLGVVVNFTQRQSHAAFVPALASTAAYAALAASEALFGPMRLVLFGLALVLRPELARKRAVGDWRGIRRGVLLTMALVGLVNLVILAALYILWGPIDRLLFADKYPDIALPVIAAGLITLVVGLRAPVSIALQADRRFKRVAMADGLGAAISVVATLAFLLVFGPLYALFGVLLGELACLASLSLAVRPLLLHGHGPSPPAV